MSKAITIQDKDYLQWVKELGSRYRRSQIKAAVKVNEEMLRFYWELGRDIVERNAENKYGSSFYASLSSDLKREIPEGAGFSERNLRYIRSFYVLYNECFVNLQQVVAELGDQKMQQVVAKLDLEAKTSAQGEEKNPSKIVELIKRELIMVPWGHHVRIVDKCKDNPKKALFFVHQTVQNGWSRDMLLNFMATDLYERQGKALTNFSRTLPEETSDLAQELTKDPYDFAFAGITGRYNERLLKDKLLNNITQFLVELGTGFAYVGKEYRLQIGETENVIDLLFYNLNLSCYVVIEVKIGKFEFADAGQLGGYVVACNHILKKESRDNPTIGILICKEKDNLVAQYALESSSQPLGISEYELAKLYPEKVEGTVPTIKELEQIEKRLDKGGV